MGLSRMDKLALLNSEVYKELEAMEVASTIKKAQSLADKIVTSPTAQQAIRDGITKALENKADDIDEHLDISEKIKELDDHTLFEFFKMFADELGARGIDPAKYEETFEEEETVEDEDDEAVEEEEMSDVFAYVKTSLQKIANNAADQKDIQSAYLIERLIQKLG